MRWSLLILGGELGNDLREFWNKGGLGNMARRETRDGRGRCNSGMVVFV